MREVDDDGIAMPESWPKLNFDRIDDDPTEIGRWFDTTVQRLEQARAESARLKAVGNDAAANLVVARALIEFRQFIGDARILTRHLAIAHDSRYTSSKLGPRRDSTEDWRLASGLSAVAPLSTIEEDSMDVIIGIDPHKSSHIRSGHRQHRTGAG